MPLNEGDNPDEQAGLASRPTQPPAKAGYGDQPTRGADETRIETAIDELEVVDLEARYRFESTLGQGGMGAVLLATDTRLGRKVAIKRILGKGANSKAAITRFMNEAKAIAALNHPNVVQIYDYGRAKDGPFLIMEYVDGGSLSARCSRRAIPLDDAIHLVCQLCEGLAKAHAAGIIHRDIKPANVLLTHDGRPKLSDFGLAKAEAADHQMTMDGTVLGTPDFMPPEQRIDAALVDARSDLWSLAATLYQMVTGRSPKIIRFDLVPTELTRVLAKALEDAKEDRFQSAQEFRDALRSVLLQSTPFGESQPGAGFETQDGQCAACGTINTDLTRKFCKKCGASLRVACRQCNAQIPVWDAICGECGGHQSTVESSEEDDASWQSVVPGDDASTNDATDSASDPLRSIDASGLMTGSHSQQDEFDELITTIVDRIKGKDVDGLLPVIERALELREDRLDLVEVRRKLVERRDDRLARALAHMDADEPDAAAMALAGAVSTDFPAAGEFRDLLDRVNQGVGLERRLADAVKQAKSRDAVTPAEAIAILSLCRAYLNIVPKSARIAKLKAQCERLSSVTNSLGMKFRIMSPGSFMMGQAYGEEDEVPHQVTLTRPFSIGVFLVTNAQWKHVMGTTPSHWQEDKGPVEQVSWDDAVAFCSKLSALPGERKAGRVYRLPTEAEWEYACRAGATTMYSFGDDESSLGDHGWYDANSGNQTHPVGQKKPNPWGLYDMHGNVWEWCNDWCAEYTKGSVTDPCGPATASRRVARGGSCTSSVGHCRSAFRYGLDPSCRLRFLGFRIALTAG
jgi:formylglycine-generating enzyme required for sulfatase activity/serine/threonine protein kinase